MRQICTIRGSKFDQSKESEVGGIGLEVTYIVVFFMYKYKTELKNNVHTMFCYELIKYQKYNPSLGIITQ